MKKSWVIPHRQNADFTAHMEDVLAVYKRPLDRENPVVCMDERPQQWIAETHLCRYRRPRRLLPIPAQEGRVERYDYEYERRGTAVLFLFAQPFGGLA